MIYQQSAPHPGLKDYVDAYWTASGNGPGTQTEKILPDGCVDIIFNLGDQCITDNGDCILEHEKVYLVGTMTRFKDTNMNPGTLLSGIRFKPGAFTAFYQFDALHEITDKTVVLEKELSPDLGKTIQYPTTYLDQFFLNKLIKPKHHLLPLIADIQNHKGRFAITDLAQRHFMTERQLERNFKLHLGVSPKEFINLVRYQYTLPVIQNRTAARSLAEIAFEQGYYDHAHLTNEIRRYTGLPPSQF